MLFHTNVSEEILPKSNAKAHSLPMAPTKSGI
jgi:hypothetical protein